MTRSRKYRSSRNLRAATNVSRFWLVAAITRALSLSVSTLPTRLNSRSCSTRNSLGCSSTGRSPISSRKIVPVSAISNLPARRSEAPVNDPRSCPNSSLSSRPCGIAEQLTATNGDRQRADLKWIARATSSLPVPIYLVLEAIEIRRLRADFHRALDRRRDQIQIGERLGQVVVSATLHRLY